MNSITKTTSAQSQGIPQLGSAGAMQVAISLRSLLAPDTMVRKYACDPAHDRLIISGSNGFTVNIPKTLDEKIAAFDCLPQSIVGLADRLRYRICEKPDALGISAAFISCLALKPNLKANERRDYVEALVEAVSIEADVSRWPLCAIAAGLFYSIKSSPYLPELCDVVAQIDLANSRLVTGWRRIQMLEDVRYDLETHLITAGVFEAEDSDNEEAPW